MNNEPLILLVDDDADDEELARVALERAQIPHRLQVVRDGAEALDWLFQRGRFAGGQTVTESTPRLILLDLKMPKMNGFEVLKQIRTDERTKLLPVVVFTSSVEEKDLAESYRRGANAYIRKPVDFREYKQLIVEVGTFWLRHNQIPAPEGQQGQPA